MQDLSTQLLASTNPVLPLPSPSWLMLGLMATAFVAALVVIEPTIRLDRAGRLSDEANTRNAWLAFASAGLGAVALFAAIAVDIRAGNAWEREVQAVAEAHWDIQWQTLLVKSHNGPVWSAVATTGGKSVTCTVRSGHDATVFVTCDGAEPNRRTA